MSVSSLFETDTLVPICVGLNPALQSAPKVRH